MIETSVAAGQRVVRPEEIDAVTLDAFGTLLELRDPIDELHRLVPNRSRDDVARAFDAEAEYYSAHAQETHDAESLERLHAECAQVFNEPLGSSLTPTEYTSAFTFEVIEGVRDALVACRGRGLALAVVANWDYGLHGHLQDAGLYDLFVTVVTAGEAGGAKKPDPTPFRVALDRLHVDAERVLHVGDRHEHDEAGAHAAGLAFAPAPLADVVREWG